MSATWNVLFWPYLYSIFKHFATFANTKEHTDAHLQTLSLVLTYGWHSVTAYASWQLH